jgi:hypothetical protein
MPLTISDGLQLESVKMGLTHMRFAKTTPDGHSIVVGLSEDDTDLATNVFREVEGVLQKDKFRNLDWSMITSVIQKDFETELLGSALVNAMHSHGFSDQCPLGDQCPMHVTAVISKREKIWSSIRKKYDVLREKMKKKE